MTTKKRTPPTKSASKRKAVPSAAKAAGTTSAAKATAVTRKATAKTAGARSRQPRPMKAYASFDAYVADQPAMHQRLIRALRRFVARTAPQLVESVKWGNGCWLSGKAPIAYVYAAEDYLQFGFVNGAALDDPKRLLRGNARFVRHVPVRKLTDLDERAFAALLLQAVELGHPAFGK